MYIHPEVWDAFGDNSLSASESYEKEMPAELSAGTIADYIIYNIIY